MRYLYYLLPVAFLLSSGTALAQTAASPQAPPPDTVAYAPAVAAQPRVAPVLPWWLPNAQECTAIRVEEARTAPREAQRRTRSMRRWAEEQPEPLIVHP